MPRNSFPDIVVDWQQLLSALDLNAEELPQLAVMREALRTLHTRAVELSNAQEVNRGVSAQTTRDIEDHLARGKELAGKLRRGVQSTSASRARA